MLELIKNLYKSRRVVLYWTVGYLFCTYAILKLMFNFSIFSAANWTRLAHAHLYGFPGFVFGILILAMVPMYVASTLIVARTGKMLVTIPLPKMPSFIKNLVPRPEPAPEPEPEPDPDIIKIADVSLDMPDGMPIEMRPQYVRARRYGAFYPAPAAPSTNRAATDTAATDTTTNVQPGELPIPTDFDFDMPTPDDNVPVFNEITFDMDDDDDTAPAQADGNIVAPEIIDNTPDNNIAVKEYLESIGREFITEDDIVISGNIAIASHNDTDFWIADTDTWFATGKSRPSPIAALTAVSARHNVQPVLFLGTENIMDLETHRAAWESAGIKIVTDIASVFNE